MIPPDEEPGYQEGESELEEDDGEKRDDHGGIHRGSWMDSD